LSCAGKLMRKEFELTADEVESIINAQEIAWAKVGFKYGFDPKGAMPTGKGDRFITAEIVEIDRELE
jgi:hypothetical protein